jgi:diguanylate cyclase (GGDEF)-like protein
VFPTDKDFNRRAARVAESGDPDDRERVAQRFDRGGHGVLTPVGGERTPAARVMRPPSWSASVPLTPSCTPVPDIDEHSSGPWATPPRLGTAPPSTEEVARVDTPQPAAAAVVDSSPGADVVALLPHPYAVLDADGACVQANASGHELVSAAANAGVELGRGAASEVVHFEAMRRWYRIDRKCAARPGGGLLTHVFATDVTELRRAEAREADRLALTRSVSGLARLDDVLVEVVQFVERYLSAAICVARVRSAGSVHVATTDRVPVGIGDRARRDLALGEWLPAGVTDPARPLFVGSAGDDPGGSPYGDLADGLGLGVRTSVPIASASGAVLGVLDVLSRAPLSPGPEGLAHVVGAAHLASIAIDQRERRTQLAYQARTDLLTHLPNRFELEALLERAIVSSASTGGVVGMLVVGLDRFKQVNDTFGHAQGDALLCAVAARLRAVVGPGVIVGRAGGDEFGVVLPSLPDPGAATDVAQDIIAALRQPIALGESRVTTTATIGIATAPEDAADARDLVRAANSALHDAKRSARGTYRFFAPTSREGAVQRIELETALREAVHRQELELHVQPQIDTRTGAIVGLEALARWDHPTLGAIPPSTFIALAEESHLIDEIGQWAFEASCAMLRAWCDAGGPPIRVGVNVSPNQLSRGDFLARVAQAAARAEVDPAMIEIEITESAMVDDIDAIVPKLEALRKLGFSVSIDDFGTGYSNLAYLQRLPIDRVKIDRIFVGGIDDAPDADPSCARIVKAIVDIARTLDLEVVAEGVETKAQLNFLRYAGCDVVQGFLYHRPMPVLDAIARFCP